MKGNRTGTTTFNKEYYLGFLVERALNNGSNVVEIRLRRALNYLELIYRPANRALAIGWISYDHPVFQNQSIPNTN